MSDAPASPYLTARQAAAYLHIAEKTLYELASRRELPSAKLGGKWLFPKVLIDEWLLEQAHSGLLADRLLIGGADDPWVQAAVSDLAQRLGANALLGHFPSSTPAGLALLAGRRLDASVLHWGDIARSEHQHAALLARQPAHSGWTVVRLAWREQGVLLRPGLVCDDLRALGCYDYRWALQPPGSGSRYFLQQALEAGGFRLEHCRESTRALSARAAAALVARGVADCTPGARALASEHGLGFLRLGVENMDLALPRGVYFRRIFQALLETLVSPAMLGHAAALCGYDLTPFGTLVEIDVPDGRAGAI